MGVRKSGSPEVRKKFGATIKARSIFLTLGLPDFRTVLTFSNN